MSYSILLVRRFISGDSYMKIFRMDKVERSELFSMYIPMFVEQFMISAVGMFITAVVKVSGMEAVAAVSLLNSLVMLFQQSFTSIGVGVTVAVAQLRGRGDPEATGSAASQSITLAFIASVSVSVLCFIFMEPMMSAVFRDSDLLVYEYGRIYLSYNTLSLPFVAIYTTSAAAIRGSGYPRISLWATLINNGAYAVMAYVSVHLMGAGIRGVSIALLISRLLAAVAGLILLLRGNNHMHTGSIKLKINSSVARPIFRVAVPLLLENLLFSGGRLVTQAFAVGYGTNSVAANGIANTIHGLMLVPGVTSSNVAPPLVGRYCGKGDLEGAKRKGFQIIWLTVLIMTLSSALILILLKSLTGTMTDIPDVQKQVYTVAVSYCIMIPVFWTLGFVTPSILRSSGDGKFTSVVCISAMVLMRITTGYLLAVVLRVGIIGIWLSMYADWIIRVSFFYPRFKSGKWLKYSVLD